MIDSELNGLRVYWGEMEVKYGNAWNDHGGEAWRVGAIESKLALPMPFVRKQDAEIAMRSIANFTDWTVNREELREVFQDKAKRDELRQLMTRNLAW